MDRKWHDVVVAEVRSRQDVVLLASQVGDQIKQHNNKKDERVAARKKPRKKLLHLQCDP